jgi:threonyl-tRNA synthetase
MQEVTSFLKMLDEVYGIFGLDYTMALSTRPESYLGEHTGHSTAQHSTAQHSTAGCMP